MYSHSTSPIWLALSIKGLTNLNTIVTLAAFTLIKLFVKKLLEFSKNIFFQEQDFVKENIFRNILFFQHTFFFFLTSNLQIKLIIGQTLCWSCESTTMVLTQHWLQPLLNTPFPKTCGGQNKNHGGGGGHWVVTTRKLLTHTGKGHKKTNVKTPPCCSWASSSRIL